MQYAIVLNARVPLFAYFHDNSAGTSIRRNKRFSTTIVEVKSNIKFKDGSRTTCMAFDMAQHEILHSARRQIPNPP